MDNRPIGVFDSGMGGLTCIPYLRERFPNENIVYYGDTARAPYGSKTVEVIEKFSFQIADFLVEHDVKMIIIACNTISATCLNALRKRHPNIPILGIISPIADKIARDENKVIEVGIIGTKVTVNSGAYANIITSKNKDVKVFSQACPAFVPLIEEDIIDNIIMDLTIQHYLDDFIKINEIKKLVMGCTHYPLLSDNLHRIYPQLELLNPSKEVISSVEKVFAEGNLYADFGQKIRHKVYASDLSDAFTRLVEKSFASMDNVEIKQKKFED